MGKQELVRYISDEKHGLIQKKELGGFDVSIQYQPAELLVERELNEQNRTNQFFVDSIQKKYSNYYYFQMYLSKNGKEAIRQLGSFSRYGDMVQVLSFGLHQFVNLTTPQKDTLQLTDYLFEQTYGISQKNRILLVFDKTKIKDPHQVEVNLSECGLGLGNLKFVFQREQLDNVTQLDYSK